MVYSRILSTLLIIILAVAAHGSYNYVGCYMRVSYNDYFETSICRCSRSGLMDQSRQQNSDCSISCPKLGHSELKTNISCGGSGTYSAYAESKLYAKHFHLFDYKIQFRLCEFWDSSAGSGVFQVKIDGFSEKLALNKLERCAAACFDQTKTVQSIGNDIHLGPRDAC
ncbi:hypothetical protein I4U23_022761 [Adineta vaga]|nr:hypothetical protein I4U23_022761 [Adineta vaga]